MKQFHERIRERMDALEINQTELANMVGVKQSSIWSLLQGDIAKPRFILELAKALKTSPQWLLTGRDDGAIQTGSISTDDNLKMLFSELASVAINSAKTGKTPENTIKSVQDRISDYFWPEIEKGHPPTYEQILRMARSLLADRK